MCTHDVFRGKGSLVGFDVGENSPSTSSREDLPKPWAIGGLKLSCSNDRTSCEPTRFWCQFRFHLNSTRTNMGGIAWTMNLCLHCLWYLASPNALKLCNVVNNNMGRRKSPGNPGHLKITCKKSWYRSSNHYWPWSAFSGASGPSFWWMRLIPRKTADPWHAGESNSE